MTTGHRSNDSNGSVNNLTASTEGSEASTPSIKTLNRDDTITSPSQLTPGEQTHSGTSGLSSSSSSSLPSATGSCVPSAPVNNTPASAALTSTVTPGLLAVTVYAASGLTLPPGVELSKDDTEVCESVARSSAAISATAMGSVASSAALARKQGSSHNGSSNPTSSSGSSSRKKIPVYLVMEYDKTQVILDAVSGTIDNPVWDKISNFDVSRSEILSIQIFARIPISGQPRNITDSSSPFSPVTMPVTSQGSRSPQKKSSSSSSSPSSSSSKYEEVFLGSCKLDVEAKAKKMSEVNLALSSGTGKLHIKVDFKPNKDKHLTIEDFDLLKVVGKGSFGKVMQVRKIDTQRIYALKTIRKAHVISRAEVNHTLAERTVLAQINNPFIVPLKFSFQSPEKLYLGLAFINGGELFHHLQREGRFDLNRARFYTAELLCALECLHEFNVIYRDLKPENILLDYTGHIALCDFGLCKLNMAGQEKTNTFCGTPEYLAPELLIGKGYTKAVDWWTLGVLFYEMLTGLPPFFDTDTNEMYRKILQDPLRFPDDMDREAKSLLIGLLERDPKKRLGANGAAEIRAHPFFAQIDWKRLLAKKYAAPFKPQVESLNDTSNFDAEFTNEVPADSVVDKDFYLSDSVQKQFGGWTYSEDSRLASSGKW